MANENQVVQPNLGPVRNQLMQLFEGIEGVYDRLREAGQTQAAFQLRQAAGQYARSGTALGLNAFTRSRALQDLSNEITQAARAAGAQEEAAKLSQQLATINQVAAVDANAFNQAMSSAQFEQSKKSELWRQQFAERELREQSRQFNVGQAQTMTRFTEQLGQQESEFARNLEQRQSETAFDQAQSLKLSGAGGQDTSLRSRFATRVLLGLGQGSLRQGLQPSSTASAVQQFTNLRGRAPTATELTALGQGVDPAFAGKFHYRDPKTGARSLNNPIRQTGFNRM